MAPHKNVLLENKVNEGMGNISPKQKCKQDSRDDNFYHSYIMAQAQNAKIYR